MLAETIRQRSIEIAEACDQAGCNKEQTKLHHNRYVYHNWMPHATPEFMRWWLPFDVDKASGASIGGHKEAKRIWARKDEGRWVRREFGLDAETAWNVDYFRREFLIWKQIGCPEQEPFISVALPMKEHAARWQLLKGILTRIGKPVRQAKG